MRDIASGQEQTRLTLDRAWIVGQAGTDRVERVRQHRLPPGRDELPDPVRPSEPGDPDVASASSTTAGTCSRPASGSTSCEPALPRPRVGQHRQRHARRGRGRPHPDRRRPRARAISRSACSRSGVDPASVDAIFLSHEHQDHSKGAASFSRKWGVRICGSRGTYAAMGLGAETIAGYDVLEPGVRARGGRAHGARRFRSRTTRRDRTRSSSRTAARRSATRPTSATSRPRCSTRSATATRCSSSRTTTRTCCAAARTRGR